jgi:hypothetical protein
MAVEVHQPYAKFDTNLIEENLAKTKLKYKVLYSEG